MSLASLGAQQDTLNSYYQALVPQANELGNAMLQGGNYEVNFNECTKNSCPSTSLLLLQVQRRMFEVFTAKKLAVEVHPEGAFLRSLQQQIRNYRKAFVDSNMDLKNIQQAKHMKAQQTEAVM